MHHTKTRKLARVEAAARCLVEAEGLLLLSMDYVQEDIGWVLRFRVDRPEGGVGINDCERVARPLSRKLDELNILKSSYFLEVTSPGVSEVDGVPHLAQAEETE